MKFCFEVANMWYEPLLREFCESRKNELSLEYQGFQHFGKTDWIRAYEVPKTEMKRFLADVQLIMEDFRSNVPHTISAKAIPTDTRGKMNDLLKFISK